MQNNMRSTKSSLTIVLFLGVLAFYPPALLAQTDMRPPLPYGHRASLVPLQMQLEEFQKTCRRAPGYYNQGGYEMLRKQFQVVRSTYASFKDTLGPNQLYEGANDLAELDAGLDVIEESFTSYQKERKNTFPASAGFDSLCNVLSRSVKAWSGQLQTVYYRLSSVHY